MKNILALDLGRGSLGIAISRSGMFVTPLENLRFPMDAFDEAILLLKDVLHGEKVEHIVIGYPSYPSGDPCPMSHIVERFIPLLEKAFPGRDIVKEDERYSTSEASDLLHRGGKNAARQHKTIDSAAACVILERYLRRIGQY
ncbi:MAG TPA: Holliday junction resolvase RuvX [Candidatus Enterosoma merdigallinarum]|nr:Holliday junction resolvase RuvX [Candidatus Enterosoma merdigallinarum]